MPGRLLCTITLGALLAGCGSSNTRSAASTTSSAAPAYKNVPGATLGSSVQALRDDISKATAETYGPVIDATTGLEQDTFGRCSTAGATDMFLVQSFIEPAGSTSPHYSA